ncbi:hypothetical protein ACFQ9Q_06580 [Streptomyces virginiae]|uniref:hypothetical protein n=1 Tax=Streptomyces virginiae TaxID=1961 RepID=UPI00368869F7
MEINTVAELLHDYAVAAGLSIKAVHEALTSEILPSGTPVPSRRQMYDLMDGRDLTRAIAHAVIDICSGLNGDPRLDEERRQRVDALFEQAETAPTPIRAGVATHGELLEAKNRLLALHDQLDNARHALQKSTEARNQAQTIMATLLLVLAHQSTTIGRLTDERDRLLAQVEAQPQERPRLEGVERRLARLRENEDRARVTLHQAERDRDTATAVAEEAGLLVRKLQQEVTLSRATAQAPGRTPWEAAPQPMTDIAMHEVDPTQTEMTLDRAEFLLEQGREAVEEAGRAIGHDATPETTPEPDTIPGQIIRSRPEPPQVFSGTTPDKHVTSMNTRLRTIAQARQASLQELGAAIGLKNLERDFIFSLVAAVFAAVVLGVTGGLAADPGPTIWNWFVFALLSVLFVASSCLWCLDWSEEEVRHSFRFGSPVMGIVFGLAIQMASKGAAGIAFAAGMGML